MSQDLEKGNVDPTKSTWRGMMRTNVDAAERRLWALYSDEAGKYDKGLALNWKGDMDAILIFAGLFTASVTAMIVESYKLLKPDSGDQTVALLAQISQQLAHMSDSAIPVPSNLITNTEPFHPSTPVVICNFLFFLSLGFTLLCAVGATLVEQWVRQYLQETQAGTPINNARLREYLHQGIVRFRMFTLVETIPFLLHISLFLFFAGLCIFIYPINHIIGGLCIAIFAICLVLYLTPTFTPIFDHSCPYRTPLTAIFWMLLRMLPDGIRNFGLFETLPNSGDGNLSMARLFAVTRESEARSHRDHKAIGWLVSSRMDDAGIQEICEILPLLCTDDFLGHHDLMFNLLDEPIMLGHRIVEILRDARHKHYIQDAQMLQRTTNCLDALRTILRTSSMHRSRGCFVPMRKGSYTWFNLPKTLLGLHYPGRDLDFIIPTAAVYIWSKVIWELRQQVEEISLESQFIEFVARTLDFFSFYDHGRISIPGEKIFLTFIPKLLPMREHLKTSALRHATSGAASWHQEKDQLLESINSAFRALVVDYILSAFVSETQGSRHAFSETAAKILFIYVEKHVESILDRSPWVKTTQEGLKAVKENVDIAKLLRDMETMATHPDLMNHYREPFRCILDALREVSSGPDNPAEVHVVIDRSQYQGVAKMSLLFSGDYYGLDRTIIVSKPRVFTNH
ncbi:hypothetical protein C8J56DRAFT_883517 [Mycena floridula]|nr:hypothetical protein C8J56DRAFT_883517 [Mycena floridula]